MKFQVLFFNTSKEFFCDRMKSRNPMFSVDDKISWNKMDEKVEIFCDRFSTSTFDENFPNNIIWYQSIFLPLKSTDDTINAIFRNSMHLCLCWFLVFEKLWKSLFVFRIYMFLYICIMDEGFEFTDTFRGVWTSFDGYASFFEKITKMNIRFFYQEFFLFEKITPRKHYKSISKIEKSRIERISSFFRNGGDAS